MIMKLPDTLNRVFLCRRRRRRCRTRVLRPFVMLFFADFPTHTPITGDENYRRELLLGSNPTPVVLGVRKLLPNGRL